MQTRYWIQWHLLRILARSYFRLSVSGYENIPPTGPLIVAANHCSFLDPPLIGLGLPRQISFLAKEELFKIPFIGWWIASVGAFPVARGKGDMKAIRMSLRLLENNAALLTFPEGTRSDDGKLTQFESGIAWLALKSQAPVLPVYIHNTNKAMPKGANFPRPYKIRMAAGPVIKAAQTESAKPGKDEIDRFNARLFESIQALEKEMKRFDTKHSENSP